MSNQETNYEHYFGSPERYAESTIDPVNDCTKKCLEWIEEDGALIAAIYTHQKAFATWLEQPYEGDSE